MRACPAAMLSQLSARSRIFVGPIVAITIAAVAALSACAARPKGKLEEVAKGTSPEASSSQSESWIFHPTSRGKVKARLVMGVETLEVDSAGSRWLRRAGGSSRVSAFGAPEGLIAVALKDARFLCVGESGTVYLSVEPLGPFVQVRTPPETFTVTERIGERLVSLNSRGQIFSSDDWGARWITSPQTQFFIDLAGTPQGGLLALSVPEQWHHSENGGKSFSILNLPSLAPRGLGHDDANNPVAFGMLADYLFSGGTFKAIVPSSTQPGRPTPKRKTILPQFARASFAAQGVAKIRQEIFAHLRPSKGSLPWRIERGGLGEALATTRVEGLDGCGRFIFSFNKNVAVALCMRGGGSESESESAPPVEIYLSTDDGHRFQKVEGKYRGDLQALIVDVSSSGKVAIGGMCAQEETKPGCRARGVTILSEVDPAKSAPTPSYEPSNIFLPGVEKPEALSFDAEARLWILGRRAKDNHLLLFGIDAGGESPLSITDLSLQGELHSSSRRKETASSASARASGSTGVDSDISILPDGELLTLVFVEGGRSTIFGIDEEGKVASLGAAPMEGAQIHGSGKNLVALSKDGQLFWQSASRGVVWQSSRLPRSVCSPLETECDARLVCSNAGCLVGEELSKIGFTGPNSEGSLKGAQGGSSIGETDQIVSYQCNLGKDDWLTLPGVVRAPTAADAALGDAAWTQVETIADRAMAVALEAPIGQSKVLTRDLFPRVSNPEAYVLYVSQQVEGSAALRYLRPLVSPNSTSQAVSVNVEVGWDNRIEGVLGGGSVTVTLDVEAAVSLRAQNAGSEFRPALISVAGRGLYLKMRDDGGGSDTVFLTGNSSNFHAEDVDPAVWPSSVDLRNGWLGLPQWQGEVREERLRLGDQHGAVLFVGSGQALLRPKKMGAATVSDRYSAYLIARLGDDLGDVVHAAGLGYRHKEVGLISMQLDVAGHASHGSFVPLLPDGLYGLPEPIPLQSHLSSRVVPCEGEQRRTTPRVVAPSEGSFERDISVVGLSGAPLEMKTDAAVLFGTVDAPCVFAWDTLPVEASTKDEREVYRVLMLPGTGAISWIFRQTLGVSSSIVTSARTMSCSEDAPSTLTKDGAYSPGTSSFSSGVDWKVLTRLLSSQ